MLRSCGSLGPVGDGSRLAAVVISLTFTSGRAGREDRQAGRHTNTFATQAGQSTTDPSTSPAMLIWGNLIKQSHLRSALCSYLCKIWAFQNFLYFCSGFFYLSLACLPLTQCLQKKVKILAHHTRIKAGYNPRLANNEMNGNVCLHWDSSYFPGP